MKLTFNRQRDLEYTSDGVVYREGTIAKDWKLIEKYIQAHWDEAKLNFEGQELDFDKEEVLKLEYHNKLCIVGAHIEGEPNNAIGYALTVKMRHQMMKSRRHALMYGFYITKEYRSYKTAKTLMKFLENVLRLRHQVEFLQVGCSVNKDLRPLFKRWGYHPIDYVYGKSLIR